VPTYRSSFDSLLWAALGRLLLLLFSSAEAGILDEPVPGPALVLGRSAVVGRDEDLAGMGSGGGGNGRLAYALERSTLGERWESWAEEGEPPVLWG
jgi:hypothetical protein